MGLPSEVEAMLIAGRWCSTAARWTVQVAEGLQAAPGPTASSSTAPGGYGGQAERPAAVVEEAAAARHDATCALLLVRAAVAALALAADVGFEAAVRYLSQEYYRVAAMVRLACPAGVPCCAVLCCAVLCCAVWGAGIHHRATPFCSFPPPPPPPPPPQQHRLVPWCCCC